MKKNYISTNDKLKIEKVCNSQIKKGELIKVKSIAITLREKYCLYDILNYIKEELNISSDKIWRGNIADYIMQLNDRKHMQIGAQDIFYPNRYYHQYVVSKELDIDIEQISKYFIHHLDGNGSNNSINNLFIFYDNASHIAFHQMLRHGKNIDIYKFNNEYIESILSDNNVNDIRNYLEIVYKKNNLSKDIMIS